MQHQVDILRLISALIDEASYLTSKAPMEPEKHAEFLMKMTASTVIASLAQALLRARKSGETLGDIA